MAKKRSTTTAPANTAAVSQPSARRQVALVPKDDVPVYYVNSVNFELSNWDIKLRLCQIHSGDPNVLNVSEVARVFMSHSHVRAFAEALNRMVERMDKAEAAQADSQPPVSH